MPSILYSVRVTCPNLQTRGRFLSWLSPNHILDVKARGAVAARVILIDRESVPDPARPEPVEWAIAETQYVFPSRKAYNTYVREHAAAMRADAQKHFPPESGVTFTRQVAEIAVEL